MGAIGGFTTYHVEPFWESSQPHLRGDSGRTASWAYRIVVMAEHRGEHFGAFVEREPMSLQVEGSQMSAYWSSTTPDDPNGLRGMLAGTPRSYLSKEGIFGEFPGALEFPPLLRANENQWWTIYNATRRKRMLDRWGTWHGGTKQTSEPPVPPPEPLDGGDGNTNEQRKRTVQVRREKLLMRAYDYFSPELEGNQKQMPGRGTVQKRFKEEGDPISDRDARWLASQLQDYTPLDSSPEEYTIMGATDFVFSRIKRPESKLIGLLGPIGVGKTTLGLQISVEGAFNEYYACRKGRWIFASLEMGIDAIRSWAVSCATGISRDPVEKVADDQKKIDILNSSWGIITPDNLDIFTIQTTGEFLDRMEKHLDLYMEKEGGISGLVIDYLGVIPKLLGCTRAEVPPMLQQLCKGFQEFAEKYCCPIYLIHQLATETLLESPTLIAEMKDAMHIKNLSKYLHGSFILGTNDDKGSVFQFAYQPRDKPVESPILLRHDGSVARLVPAEDMTIDHINQRITCKA